VNLLTKGAFLLNKSSRLLIAKGATAFIRIDAKIIITLRCYLSLSQLVIVLTLEVFEWHKSTRLVLGKGVTDLIRIYDKINISFRCDLSLTQTINILTWF
jgi:hypothetical protein